MDAEEECRWDQRLWVERRAHDERNEGEWKWRQDECEDEREDCGLRASKSASHTTRVNAIKTRCCLP